MEKIGNKVGCLKGLIEALDPESDIGKLMSAVYDVVSALAERTDVFEEELADLNDYVESIDDDLSELEEDFPNGKLDLEEMDDGFPPERENEPLRIVPNPIEKPEAPAELALSGCLCPKCGKMFFIPAAEPDGVRYDCPHCGKSVLPEPLTPENAPIAKRSKK